ncbi:MAG: glycosyltransferase family 2 protein [Clostridia bacterium]|nr:glycosyltransferase family 2 protein [Clostridia bacterium]MBR7164208.1 glycosyltransferase family 2 protein [Clostridia bacterium]
MFFSVIVPVYKVEKYLSGCIESVLNQTFSDFELILVDDGSPDRCPEICDTYKEKDERIKVIHKSNGGLASARRAGIKEARGDYVFNLDSDDLIENDSLECAYKIIKDTNCDIVSFSYKWVKNGHTVNITNDGLDEGFYTGKEIEKYIYPRLLMDKDMNHLSYYLSGKAIKRELLTPHQLGVSEKISLGEDLCCTLPCYLHAKSVYISKKEAYLYTVREDSLSKEFNTKQIYLIEDVINEISKNDMEKVIDFDKQVCRYSCFMCFTILASAAEGNHFKSIKPIKENIINSLHGEKIQCAEFEKISPKSRIAIFFMKKKCYKTAFYFLNVCKNIRNILKKG